MRALGKGRILVTGSIAGFMPGTYKAVYNGTKAFIDSFSFLNEVNGAGDVRVDDVAGGVEVLIEKGFAQTMSGVGEQRGKRATATSRASDLRLRSWRGGLDRFSGYAVGLESARGLRDRLLIGRDHETKSVFRAKRREVITDTCRGSDDDG
jgi:NAD(P)-dependent dehydrogenase (short-subunit alcohol dehydrogenase family)